MITLEPDRLPRHTGRVTERVRTAVRVEGIVQGVGFRPFVYALASGLSLGGLVGNDADGVFAEVEGPPAAIGEFLRRLETDAPPLARVDRVRTWAVEPDGSAGSRSSRASRTGPVRRARRWCRRTRRRARTACASWPTRRTGGSAIRSSTARTAGHGSRSSGTCRTTGPAPTMARFHDVPGLRGRVRVPGEPALPRRADALPRLRPIPGADQPGPGSALAELRPRRADDSDMDDGCPLDGLSWRAGRADGDVIGAAAAMLREGHVLRSRDWAVTTWRWTRPRRRPWQRCARTQAP